MVHRAAEWQRLRGKSLLPDRAAREACPVLVAIAVERGQHDGAIEGFCEQHTVGEALAEAVEMLDVLPAASVWVACLPRQVSIPTMPKR